MKTDSQVVAVVCHYNMAQSLGPLLKQIKQQGYDLIIVLDDASTDRSIEKLAKRLPEVLFVFGDENRGAAGNRNRILELKMPDLDKAIIHFLDADVVLLSQNTPTIIHKKYQDKPDQLIGGLVVMPDGSHSIFNYGPRHSLHAALSGYAALHLGKLYQKSPAKADRFYKRFYYFLKDCPNIAKPIKRREIFWCEEANMVIPFKIFKLVGGFDGRLRYHEIQDLSIKLHKLGIPLFFDAAIAVEHPFFNFSIKQWPRMQKASLMLFAKYGLRFK